MSAETQPLAYTKFGILALCWRQAHTWSEPESVKVGYEINFNWFLQAQGLRLFEKFRPYLRLQKKRKGFLQVVIGVE